MEADEKVFKETELGDTPPFLKNLELFKHYGELLEHFVMRFGSVFINVLSANYSDIEQEVPGDAQGDEPKP